MNLEAIEFASTMIYSGNPVKIEQHYRGGEPVRLTLEIEGGEEDVCISFIQRNTDIESLHKELEYVRKQLSNGLDALLRLNQKLPKLLDALPDKHYKILEIWEK